MMQSPDIHLMILNMLLLIVVLTHIGNKFTYRLGLHFC
jgi:hypothetical protein